MTAYPTAAWVAQTARNLVMDLEDAGCRMKCLIRDRNGKYPGTFDAVLAEAGITLVRSGVRVPRMNSRMERWVRTCRRALLDRTLIFNQRHLVHTLREFEIFYNGTGRTRASRTPGHSHPYPNRSPTLIGSPT